MGWVRENTGIDLTGDNSLLGKTLQASESVVQKLGNTIESIVSDPRKLAAVGVMIAFPGAATSIGEFLLPEAAVSALGTAGTAVVGQTAINTALNGGDLDAAVKAALVQQGLPAVTNSLAASQLGKDMQEIFGKYGAQAATQAGMAAILGKDPVAAFVFSGAQAATDLIMQQVGANDALKDLPQSAQNAVRASITAAMTGKDAATAAANSLVNSLIRGAQTQIAVANKTGGQTILTPEQVKAVGESQILPTSGVQLDNTIRYAQLMNEGKVLNDFGTLTYAASLGPADYAQLEKYQMSRVPAQDVATAAQQLINAITSPESTVSYPSTQVADLEGKTGVPSDQATDQDLEQLGVGLATGDDLIGQIIDRSLIQGTLPTGTSTPSQSDFVGPPVSSELTHDDLVNIITGQDSVMGGEATTQGGAGTETITGGQDSVMGGEATTQGGASTDVIDQLPGQDTQTGGQDITGITQDDGTTGGVQDVIDTLEGGDGTDTLDTTCADGFHWDDTLQICVADTDKTQTSTDCPDGYVYNVVTQACEPITTDTGTGSKTGTGGTQTQQTQQTQPSAQQPALTQQNSSGLNLAALLALMGGGGQQGQPAQPAVADTSGMVDIEELLANPLQTDYRKSANKPKMAEGGSIDDLLALLNQKG